MVEKNASKGRLVLGQTTVDGRMITTKIIRDPNERSLSDEVCLAIISQAQGQVELVRILKTLLELTEEEDKNHLFTNKLIVDAIMQKIASVWAWKDLVDALSGSATYNEILNSLKPSL